MIEHSGRLSGRSLIPAFALAVLGFAWTAGMVMWPRPGEPVAAIFPPWASEEAAVAATSSANAQAILGFGALATIVVARSDDPRFAEELHRLGALFVVRAKLVGCFSS